jgi:hypothetical protein
VGLKFKALRLLLCITTTMAAITFSRMTRACIQGLTMLLRMNPEEGRISFVFCRDLVFDIMYHHHVTGPPRIATEFSNAKGFVSQLCMRYSLPHATTSLALPESCNPNNWLDWQASV